MFLGMFAREERERKDCERVSVSETVRLLFVSVSKETEEMASCTRVEEASDMQARRNDAVWGPLSPQKPNTAPFWGPLSPKCPTQHRFGNFYFPPKAQHGTVLAIFISPQKPTRRRFGDQLSHQIFHVGPAHSFCLFWFLYYFGLVWFKWINGFGLFFNLG